MIRKLISGWFLLLFFVLTLNGQIVEQQHIDTTRIITQLPDSSSITENVLTINNDTLKNSNSQKTEIDTGFVYHSPMRAALLSATLPGLGQIYNKKYWKVPLIYAAIGVSAYYFAQNQVIYKGYLQGYVDLSNTHDSRKILHLKDMPLYLNQGKSEEKMLEILVSYMDFYRRLRDISVICMTGAYFLNIIDATVDGYLFDYDISENISMHLEPTFTPLYAFNTYGLKMTFNLHK